MSLQRVYFRYGLQWPTRTPPWKRPLFAVFVLALLIAVGMTLSHYVKAADSVYTVQEWKDAYRKALLDCLSGGTVFFPDTRQAFKCNTVPLGKV